jgi:hypothetical protein
MATVPVRNKTAEGELLDRLGKQFDEAAEKDPKQFVKQAKRAITKLRQSTAARLRRRGTA